MSDYPSERDAPPPRDDAPRDRDEPREERPPYDDAPIDEEHKLYIGNMDFSVCSAYCQELFLSYLLHFLALDTKTRSRR